MTSAQAVLQQPELLWAYPDVASLPPEQQPEFGRRSMTNEEFNREFYRRYVGAPDVTDVDRIAGFSRSEMNKADQTGVVKTVNDNTIFLTFDDWGKDNNINPLLYVLRKHGVHATFFIITRNMTTNPNLLRAIAADGNEIASHTDHHVAMTQNDEKGRPFHKEDFPTYKAQVAESYDKLLAVCGDMRIPAADGGTRPALTRLMRPPTLAISKEGIKALLESGFTYIVNGYGSTEDYAAVSMQSLVGIIDRIIHDERGNVRRGAIVIMHMSGTAKRTAAALDMLLTRNEQLPDGHPKKFRVGLLGDYLVGDYSQTMKQEKDKRPRA